MEIRRFLFILLALVIGGLGGFAKPDSAEAFTIPASWIKKKTIVLEERGDKADVYFVPIPDFLRQTFEDHFPVVALLQGGKVDKKFYEKFGRQLARFGFVVVIPNHFQGPILLPDQFVPQDVIEQMKIEDADPESPLHLIVDTDRLGLVGHSVGGVVSLFVIEGSCNPPFCFGVFEPPEALRAGAVYGTNTCTAPSAITIPDPRCEPGEELIDVDTNGFPVALVQGTRDGIAPPAEAEATFDILDDIRKLISIRGANHYGINGVNNPPGTNPDPMQPKIRQSLSVRRVARRIGLFLRIHTRH